MPDRTQQLHLFKETETFFGLHNRYELTSCRFSPRRRFRCTPRRCWYLRVVHRHLSFDHSWYPNLEADIYTHIYVMSRDRSSARGSSAFKTISLVISFFLLPFLHSTVGDVLITSVLHRV